MKIGKMNRRITIRSKTVTKDTEGITQNVWSTVATVWAWVEPLRGKEYFEAAATNAENTVRFHIRYMSGLTSKMQVLYESRLFNINSVIDIDERHREMQLICTEVVGWTDSTSAD